MEYHSPIPNQTFPKIEIVFLRILSGLSSEFLLGQVRSFRHGNVDVIVADFCIHPYLH